MFVRDFSDLDILIDPTDEALFISVMGKWDFAKVNTICTAKRSPRPQEAMY